MSNSALYCFIFLYTMCVIKVESSSVGPIQTLPVRLALEVLVALMTDEINRQVLAPGFALPDVPFIAFVQPELQLLPGILAVQTDLAYQGDSNDRVTSW